MVAEHANEMASPTLRSQLQRPGGVFAPLVLNPLMARLAEAEGFTAGYVGGGAMGFVTCATEANLGLTEMLHAGLDIRAQSRLQLILDGTCGWGDPMHVQHTVRSAEAAGFAAIEIEDQILPKRAHHHVGVEHLISAELMADKIRAAVDARRSADFLVIARTNAARVTTLADAIARAGACHAAGADILLVMPGRADDVQAIAAALPPPLMYMTPVGGVSASGIELSELNRLGYQLIVDPGTPFFAMFKALRLSYAAMRAGNVDPLLDCAAEERSVHRTLDLDRMLEIERRTVER